MYKGMSRSWNDDTARWLSTARQALVDKYCPYIVFPYFNDRDAGTLPVSSPFIALGERLLRQQP